MQKKRAIILRILLNLYTIEKLSFLWKLKNAKKKSLKYSNKHGKTVILFSAMTNGVMES